MGGVKAVITALFPVPPSSTPAPCLGKCHSTPHLHGCNGLLAGFLSTTFSRATGMWPVLSPPGHRAVPLFSHLQWLSVACCISPNFSPLFPSLQRLRATQALRGQGCLPPVTPTQAAFTTARFDQTVASPTLLLPCALNFTVSILC